MKTSTYYEETNQLLATFSEADRQYFSDLWDYFNLASMVYNEVAVREAVYNLALDFKDAADDGIRAADYFGKNPKEMVDQMLPNFPKDNLRAKIHIGLLVSGIIVFYRFLSTYATTPDLVVKPLVYLVDIALSLVVIHWIFDLLAATIFASKKREQILYGLGIVLIITCIFIEVFGVRLLPEWGWFLLPHPWDSLILFGSTLLLLKWQWKEAAFRPFFLPVLGFLINGLLQRFFLSGGPKDPLLGMWIPIAITVLCLIGFYWWSFRLFRKDRQK